MESRKISRLLLDGLDFKVSLHVPYNYSTMMALLKFLNTYTLLDEAMINKLQPIAEDLEMPMIEVCFYTKNCGLIRIKLVAEINSMQMPAVRVSLHPLFTIKRTHINVK